jgi:low affinity Fe/Cu permease
MTLSKKIDRLFTAFSAHISSAVGQPVAFVVAFGIVILWALSGPAFGFSDTWQLVINTSTTIITFLMVFIIQNSQNRDAAAMQAKLDELLRAVAGRARVHRHRALTDERRSTALEEEASSPPAGKKAKHDSLQELLKRR